MYEPEWFSAVNPLSRLDWRAWFKSIPGYMCALRVESRDFGRIAKKSNRRNNPRSIGDQPTIEWALNLVHCSAERRSLRVSARKKTEKWNRRLGEVGKFFLGARLFKDDSLFSFCLFIFLVFVFNFLKRPRHCSKTLLYIQAVRSWGNQSCVVSAWK